MMAAFLFILMGLLFQQALHSGVEANGLIEVFQWRQMDYYNRGNNYDSNQFQPPAQQQQPQQQQQTWTGNANSRPRGQGTIVFPGQLHRQKRDTSRDQSVDIKNRFFNVHKPTYNNNNNNSNSSSPASYIPYNNVPMGATHHNGRLFVTMPRRRTGIPSTLNYIDLRRDGQNPSPKLIAYPNYEANELNANQPVASPNKIISVYRTSVDACKRLWFIDTGMLEYPGNSQQVQRPSIWVMDLNSDRLERRFEIPESVVATGQGLASITVDVDPAQCSQAFAYIPDLINRQLFVYSLATNRIWGFSHNYFSFDPLAGDLSIGGQNFRWDDGIFSITLGSKRPDGYRTVFFHPMASNNEFTVSSQVLQNEANANRSDHGNDFQPLGSRGQNRQSTMHEFDPRTGVIFYDEIQRNGVGCWNTNKRFNPQNHGAVAADPQRMIYPSDLTIDDEGTIWVMTNSMPIFIYSTLDPNTVNFRVWKQNVHKAIENTVCSQ